AAEREVPDIRAAILGARETLTHLGARPFLRLLDAAAARTVAHPGAGRAAAAADAEGARVEA
ncbi:MAG: hypothetical protein ABIV26_01530, partial [Candidatus Limnocylindrales bacterium]